MAETTLTEDAFLEPRLKEIGDFKLRPFTLGSVPICKKLGLSQFTGDTVGEIPRDEQLRQVAGFLWAHCEPIEEVLRALRLPAADLEEHVLRYALQVPVAILPDVMAEIERVGQMTGAAQVEIIEKPSAPGASQAAAPGNS